MVHTLKRITKAPGTALKIQVDHRRDEDGQDAGLMGGGLFHFAPAGEDGDTHQMSDHAAQAIMGDPGLAKHFDCQPPIQNGDTAKAEPVKQVDKAPAATEKKAGGKRSSLPGRGAEAPGSGAGEEGGAK